MICLTLAGYKEGDPPIDGSRPFARERLYDEWIGFVIQAIDGAAGTEVEVNANRFNGPGEEISGDTEGKAKAALERLWTDWRKPGGPGGPPCPRCGGECLRWPEACEDPHG